MDGLTPRQQEFIDLLRKIDPSADMDRVIEDLKHDAPGRDDRVVRGLTRLRGFTPEP
ncbi:hypothetical protein [Microbacterium arborescens]|uniref:hypothetical protein n=1 Tax=Microbacterium arborescens TaxID=33883 RepID=UPI000AB78F84|nr:hypothetical protein [Microbacterium arborescens]